MILSLEWMRCSQVLVDTKPRVDDMKARVDEMLPNGQQLYSTIIANSAVLQDSWVLSKTRKFKE